MQITREWLEKHNACPDGKEWFLSQGIFDPILGVKNLFAKGHFSWACWLLSKMFSRRQNVLFAIYCAEKVIDIFEKKYLQNKCPRKAIQAAKRWIKNPNKQTANAAYTAANAAANVAYAAYAAANAADAAANAAAYAANVGYAIYAAAYAANAAAYTADTTKIKKAIIYYGIKLYKNSLKIKTEGKV
jgi:hypothetical protein